MPLGVLIRWNSSCNIHALSLVDTELFDSIGVVRKIEDGDSGGLQHSSVCQVTKTQLVSHCVATGVPSRKTDVSNISEYYRTTSNARLNEAFFARFVIVAEGETEELVLPEYLTACGLSCDMRGVSIIGVEGKNQIPKYWRLFSSFQIPVLVIFDNDDDTNGDKRNSNNNLISCFGITLNQILKIPSWAKIESGNSPKTRLIVLKTDFEKAIEIDYSNQHTGYETFVTEAKALIRPLNPNQGKGLIARFVARKIIAAHPTYKPAFLVAIADHINHTLGFLSANSGEEEE